MTEIFTSFEIMKEHHEIVPPLVGQQVFIDSEDDDHGYYIFDGEDWLRE